MINKLKMLSILGPIVLSMSSASAWQDVLDVKCTRATSVGVLANEDLEKLSTAKLNSAADYTIDFSGTVISTGVNEKEDGESKLSGTVKSLVVKDGASNVILNLSKIKKQLKLGLFEKVTLTGESGPRLENRRLINFKHSKFSILGMYDTNSTTDQNLDLVIAPEKEGELPLTFPLSCEVKLISSKK